MSTTSGPERAKLIFCSSIAAALESPVPAVIPTTPLEDLSQAGTTGYGRSKFVAEKVIQNAVEAGARAKVLRIGQIMPSHAPKASKLWNQNEMIPLILRSSKILGALPKRLPRGDTCTWTGVMLLQGW